MLVSHVHRKKPASPADAGRSRQGERKEVRRARPHRARLRRSEGQDGLVRAHHRSRSGHDPAKIGLANLVHNMRRLLWLERQTALT